MGLFERYAADMDNIFLGPDFAQTVTIRPRPPVDGGAEEASVPAVVFAEDAARVQGERGTQVESGLQVLLSRAGCAAAIGRLGQYNDEVEWQGAVYTVVQATLDPAAITLRCTRTSISERHKGADRR